MQIKNRKTIRLKSFDYSQPGFYFVTVCVQDRKCWFGEIVNGEMTLNGPGKIVEQYWKEIPSHYPNIQLDSFVIMPNHLHGIVIIDSVGAASGRPQAGNAHPYNLSSIIGSFKNISSKSIHKADLPDFSWQKSFYDHVIRQDESLDKIREYIVNNPKQWELDKENPKNNS